MKIVLESLMTIRPGDPYFDLDSFIKMHVFIMSINNKYKYKTLSGLST
jgi:hypothetical protein